MAEEDPRFGLTRTWAETDEISLVPRTIASESGLARGAALGRYIVLECLGAGAMGIVFAAYDPELDRRVAVKVLHARGSSDASAGRARLLREAQAMARLSHPNVVTVHDVGTFEGDLIEGDGLPRVFVAMEFVEGITLNQWLGERPRAWREVLEVLVPVARALHAIHEGGVVHRDVKPDNIMVGRDGRVRLMDLGLARPVELGRPAAVHAGDAEATASLSQPRNNSNGARAPIGLVTRRGAIAGTPAYMAPEQYLRGEADAKSDQFSFCVTLFEALHRVRPFEGASLHELAEKIVEGRIVAPPRENTVPGWLQAIVLRGLQTDPGARFPTMEALVAELTRERRRTGVRASMVVGAAAVGVLGWRAWSDRGDACADAGAPMEQVWNGDRRGEIERAFAATGAPWADDTTARAFAKVDAYADAWTAMRLESCRAATRRDDASIDELALRNACLDERLAELGAWLDVLAAADRKVIERAVGATSALPPIGQCADRAYLAARQRPWIDHEVGEQVAEVRTRLSRIKALERAGHYDEGMALALEAVADATRTGERPLMAEAAYRLGELQNGAGKFTDAEASLTAAFGDARWSRHELIAIDAANLLAYIVGVNEGRHDDALLWARIAEAELGPTGQETEAHASLLNNLGNIHAGRADYPKAREHLERAIEIATALHGSDHLLVAKYRGNLVPVVSQLGRPQEAIELGNEVLRVVRAELGPDHPYVGIAHNNVCSAIYATEDVDGAVACFIEALAEHERALGPDHFQVAPTLNNIGAMLHLQGRDEEAYSYLSRARKVFDVAYPADHPQVAGLELNLGTCALALGRTEEAIGHLRRALDVRVKTLGDDHETVAEARTELAAALAASGRLAEALAELEMALTVAATNQARRAVQTGRAPDDPFIARIRAQRGLVWAAMGSGTATLAERELAWALETIGAEAGRYRRSQGELVDRARLALARLRSAGHRSE